jgi:cytosine deaminase
MTPLPDLVLRNGRLPDGRAVDVHVAGGRISAVRAAGSGDVESLESIDLAGRLLLPAMVDPHAHLDKAGTADLAPNLTGGLLGAIDAFVAAMERGEFDVEGMVERAVRAIEQLVLAGVTAIRTHVNVGEEVGTLHLRAVRAAAQAFADSIDLQTVALVHSPVTGAAGAGHRRALAAALAEGVDLVGGCAHLDTDPTASIDVLIDAASDAGVPLDLHTDETLDPSVLTLRDVARRIRDRAFPHPVTASHCVSLSVQPLDVQRSVAAEVADAGIAVIPLPQTNLYLNGQDHPVSTPRAIAPIAVLRDAGVLVAAGADNLQDPFNPVGRADPLHTAALLVTSAHQQPDDAYGHVSNDARAAMGLARIAFAIGDPADLVAVAATSVRAAIAEAPADRIVLRGGRVVARTTVEREVLGRRLA